MVSQVRQPAYPNLERDRAHYFDKVINQFLIDKNETCFVQIVEELERTSMNACPSSNQFTTYVKDTLS